LHLEIVEVLNAEPEQSDLISRVYIDQRGRVYVIGGSRGNDRQQVINQATCTLVGALSFYEKERGLIVVDRIGENLEFSMIEGFRQHAEYRELGNALFGSVSVTTFEGSVSAELERTVSRRKNR
jgi:hypothetical protein